MTILLSSSTATSSTATEGEVKTYLANLRTYIADLLGTDSTDKSTVLSLIGSALNGKLVKTAAYTVVAGDRGKVIECTGTWTLNITAAATLGDGFVFAVINDGSGVITIDPNLSEQINNQTSITVASNEFVMVYCSGAEFKTIGGGLPYQAGNNGKLLTTNGTVASWAYYATPKLKAVSGRYYLPHGVAISVNGMNAAATTGKIWFMPFLVGAGATYSAICTHLQTAVAGKVVRLGIYSDSNGVPGSLVLDAGTVSTATIGTKEITINQALTAGWYWLAFISDATTGADWSAYKTGVSANFDFGLGTSVIDGTATVTTDFYVGYYGTQAYGALPSTPPALIAVKSSNAALPLVALKG